MSYKLLFYFIYIYNLFLWGAWLGLPFLIRSTSVLPDSMHPLIAAGVSRRGDYSSSMGKNSDIHCIKMERL